MLYSTALLVLAGLASVEAQTATRAAKTTAKAAATGASAAKAPAAPAKPDFAWTTPAQGATWAQTQGQSIAWTGTSPTVFDVLLINQNPGVQPLAQMPVANNVPITFKNITLTMQFGPATNFALLAVNTSNHAQVYAQSPFFSVTGGVCKFNGFPLASAILATAPATAAAACTTSGAAAGATGGVQLPVGAGTSTTFVSSPTGTGVVALATPSSASSLAIGGLASCLVAALAIFLA